MAVDGRPPARSTCGPFSVPARPSPVTACRVMPCVCARGFGPPPGHHSHRDRGDQSIVPDGGSSSTWYAKDGPTPGRLGHGTRKTSRSDSAAKKSKNTGGLVRRLARLLILGVKTGVVEIQFDNKLPFYRYSCGKMHGTHGAGVPSNLGT